MYNLTYKLMTLLLYFTAICLTACKEEYEYTSRGDTFQPRLIDLDANADGMALINGNSIRLMWYKVNAAKSYTVEVCNDTYYKTLFASYEVKDPTVFIDDIPYSTQYYIRIRSNAADPSNNSMWTTTSAKTDGRPEFASILKEVVNINDNGGTLLWTIDKNNPVDSISIIPMASDTLKSMSRTLTSSEMATGKAVFTGLDKNTLYAVDLYDNHKKRKYDKPYNQLTFRTTGPKMPPVQLTRFDDLSTILRNNNNDPSIPEGLEYRLPAGSYYQLQPFAIQKGFKLVGTPGGDPVQIELGGNWDIASASSATAQMTLDAIEFENIEFLQTIDASYFFNNSCPFKVNKISFTGCKFTNFRRGFWRQKDVHSRHIKHIIMDNCIIDQCFGHSGPYGMFNFEKDGNKVDSIDITNSTFMREANDAKNFFSYGNITTPIRMVIRNVTFYQYCAKKQSRLIDLNNAGSPSTLIIENVLFATNCGQIYRASGNTKVSLIDNYATSDCKRGVKEFRTDKDPKAKLNVSAHDLFVNAREGNLTIKDKNSIIVKNRVGDPRWLP